ncbi:hypothetical protein [Paraburkholderia phenazinium]|nr:hypothetical protein [Paraburkholderia phenazinium]
MAKSLPILWMTMALVPWLTACTELRVDPLPAGSEPTTGDFVYSLPRTTLQITGSITLNSCTAFNIDGKGAYEPGWDISETVTVTPIYEADPDAQYQVPYDTLRSLWKETSVTITSAGNKTITGLNGVVNDQVGSAVLAAGLAAVQIVGGLGVVSVPTAAAEKLAAVEKNTTAHLAKAPAYCSPSVTAALDRINQDMEKIHSDAIADAKQKSTVANPEITSLQSEIARLQAETFLTRRFSVVWSPSFTDSQIATATKTIISQSLPLYGTYIQDWLSDDGKKWLADNSKSSKALALTSPVIIQVELNTWTMGPQPPATPQTQTTSLVLRDPALGTLRACRGSCVSSAPATLTEVTGDLTTPVTLAFGQFGRSLVLPLKNQVFENSSLALLVNADGSLSSQGNHSTPTLATGLGTAGQIGTTIGTNQTNRNTSITAQNTAEATNASAVDTANKTLADCLSEQQAVRAAGGTPIGVCQ